MFWNHPEKPEIHNPWIILAGFIDALIFPLYSYQDDQSVVTALEKFKGTFRDIHPLERLLALAADIPHLVVAYCITYLDEDIYAHCSKLLATYILR